jgi:integrase
MQKKRFTFTGDKLRALPVPSGGRARYYDDVVRGLMLEITENDARSFRCYKKFRGRPTKITLGWFDPNLPETRDLPEGAEPLDLLRGSRPALNVKMARKLAVAILAELDTGVNPAEEAAQSRRGISLGELFEKYRAHLKAMGKKSLPLRVWMWERYLGPLPEMTKKKHGAERTKALGAVDWSRRHLGEITHAMVTKLMLDLGEKVGRTTANRVVELLRAMFNFARRQKLYQGDNPAEDIERFHLPSRERFLQAHEVERFFKALTEEKDPDFADYVRLLLYTGAHRGNILRMRWDELSLDGAQWTVSGEKMKNGKPLVLPLVEEAVEILRRRAAKANGNPWVFPGNTVAGHMGSPRKKWAEFVEKAELPDLRVHDLRRTLGSWMASTGASTTITMKALGHRSVTTAMIYQQLAADPVREAAQRAVTAMLNDAKGKSVQLKGQKARVDRHE